MKRIVLEWGLIFSTAIALAFFGLWARSQFIYSPLDAFEVGTVNTRNGIDHIYLVWATGNISICNGTHEPGFWGMPGYRQLTIPGFDAWCYYGQWAIKFSPLIPAALASLAAIFLYRRLRRLRRPVPAKSS